MEKKVVKIRPTIPKIIVKKRVAAYVRVSSGKDAMLHSLSAQISYYSEYIQRKKEWEYIGVYADEATTGTKTDRTEFQRLLNDCRNGKVDIVITKSISRFARNTVTMLETVRELKLLSIDVYFEKENIHSMSGDGELMLTILSSYAQEESRSVSENCKWHIRKKFKEGQPANWRFMYGYNINKGIITINEKQAYIVKGIFEAYVNGIGATDIARKIRNANVPTVFGGKWTAKSVRNILKNEKYTGNSLLQKRYVSDHLTKAQIKNKGELPMYYAEGTHPAIIDIDTFEKANQIMDENKESFGCKSSNNKYPFTSKIKCAKCGKNYKRVSKRGKISWNCSTFRTLGKEACHAKQIPDEILKAVTAKVLDTEKFDELAFEEKIKEIIVPEFNKLIFVLKDGKTINKAWQDKSRKWTDDKKLDIWKGEVSNGKSSNSYTSYD